ncbi:hypothetical protein D3C80_1512830 [compost metagenome]
MVTDVAELQDNDDEDKYRTFANKKIFSLRFLRYGCPCAEGEYIRDRYDDGTKYSERNGLVQQRPKQIVIFEGNIDEPER